MSRDLGQDDVLDVIKGRSEQRIKENRREAWWALGKSIAGITCDIAIMWAVWNYFDDLWQMGLPLNAFEVFCFACAVQIATGKATTATFFRMNDI